MSSDILKQTSASVAQPGHPLVSLPVEDLEFITEFVVRSGSLKDVASVYGVSYPTIRGRLDRLIERVRDALAARTVDPVAALLAKLVERGEMSVSAAVEVRDLVRKVPLKKEVQS